MENVSIDQQIIELLAKIQTRFEDEKKAIEFKKQELMKIMKDKVLLQDWDARLKTKEADLEKRELDLKKEKELNRQKSEDLVIREKHITNEKARLQTMIDNI